MIRLSCNVFPSSPREKDKSGLIWGCTVQPLCPELSVSVPNETSPLASEIARCKSCSAYINPFVNLGKESWVCTHCRNENPFEGERYNTSLRSTLPELSNNAVDYRVNEPTDELDITDLPIFIMIVDISAPRDSEYYSRVKDTITAAIEAMPDSTRFGLITFDDKVGLWNLRGIENQDSILTHVHKIPISESKSSRKLSISDILSPEKFLVPLDENRVSIANTIEHLAAMSKGSNKRALGNTVELLTEFFGNFDPMSVRATIFLSDRPNYGVGAINNLPPAEQSIFHSSSFYTTIADQSTKSGVCYDVIAFAQDSATSFGLPYLKVLATNTGGNLLLYGPDNRQCARDIYRRFSSALGFHCIIRLRCPNEYEVHNAYGHLVKDDTYGDLYHSQGCDIWKTFAFDFKHSSPSGFIHASSRDTVLQFAFAYAYLPGKNSDEPRYKVERRLRIHTIQITKSLALPKIYASCDAEVTMLLLTHKLSQELFKKGIKEVRTLLQDWLTLLLVKYNRFIVLSKDQDQAFRATNIDLAFSQFPNLSWLPRLVFGLLKSPLLSERKLNSIDYWVFLHSFISYF